MTLLWVLDGWPQVAGQLAWCSAAVPIILAILHQLLGRLRDRKPHSMVKMILRVAPGGSMIASITGRRGGESTVLVVHVGETRSGRLITSAMAGAQEISAR